MFKRKKFDPTEPPARWLHCPRKAVTLVVGNGFILLLSPLSIQNLELLFETL